VILCDKDIESAIRTRKLVIDPVPESGQYDSSSINLRVGSDFRTWKQSLWARGSGHSVNIDEVELEDLIDLTDQLVPNEDGLIVIPPNKLVLVRTFEYIHLPKRSKLAARVEGRSKMARLGMTAHLTAPTIHAGFRGKITLEIYNFGPFKIEVRPNWSRLCQLIIEVVSSVPEREGSKGFSDQETPLGTPKRGPSH